MFHFARGFINFHTCDSWFHFSFPLCLTHREKQAQAIGDLLASQNHSRNSNHNTQIFPSSSSSSSNLWRDMDWDSVSAEDVIEALREVEWSTRPRSLAEFFSRFAFPRSFSKLMSRLKCNLYYYRTNYFILLIFVLGLALITRPLAILGAALTALSLAFLNDSFAATFNEKMIRTIRHFSPHLAAKMRPPQMPVIRGRSAARKKVHICGQPRLVFVLIGLTASFVLWFTSCGLLWVLYALTTALLMIILHASLRTPNLKARLNTFREEFRAVWRNYSDL